MEGKIMNILDEEALLSLFECKPDLLDKSVPFFYNEATYTFTNSFDEKFKVTVTTASMDIKVQTFKASNNELDSLLDFKNAKEIKILKDTKEQSSILIRTDHYSTEIDFKPKFKVRLTYTDSE